jgi:Flp pilus assembly protein TadD
MLRALHGTASDSALRKKRGFHGVLPQKGALVGAFLLLALSGCAQGGGDVDGAPASLTVQEPGSPKYFPSDEPYRLGAEQFNRGNYGLAESYFRDAVEKSPGDGAAWAGLAASYDRVGRFDLADRAYARAIAISGETVQILNNQGYSLMLRGNIKAAQAKFGKAAQLDPGNPTILNNLLLLRQGGPLIKG